MASRGFSIGWTLLSVVVFLAVELLIGTFVGPLVVGKYVSPPFQLQLQMMMHLASFLIGGLIIGFFSPGLRLAEPALAALISVAAVWTLSFFMPTWFYGFSVGRVLVGGGIATVLALLGAYWGERLTGNIKDEPEDAATDE